MSFVIVSADFSCCKSEERAHIYEQLLKDNWVNIREDADRAHMSWISSVTVGLLEEDAVTQIRNKFYSCCKPNCKPRVVFEWAESDAAYVNLT